MVVGTVAWLLVGVLAGAPEPRVVSALEKVRPGALPPGEKQARLSLARGECEGVQVVLPPGTCLLYTSPSPRDS